MSPTLRALNSGFALNFPLTSTSWLRHCWSVPANSWIRRRELERQFFASTIHQIARFLEQFFKTLLGRGSPSPLPRPLPAKSQAPPSIRASPSILPQTQSHALDSGFTLNLAPQPRLPGYATECVPPPLKPDRRHCQDYVVGLKYTIVLRSFVGSPYH